MAGGLAGRLEEWLLFVLHTAVNKEPGILLPYLSRTQLTLLQYKNSNKQLYRTA